MPKAKIFFQTNNSEKKSKVTSCKVLDRSLGRPLTLTLKELLFAKTRPNNV